MPDIRWRWKGPVGHPRAFVSVLIQVLEDGGFSVGSENYEEKAGVLRDTAYFTGHVSGKKHFRLFSGWKLVAVVFVCLVVPILGWLALWVLLRDRWRFIWLSFDGEQYMATGRGAKAERVAVVSDVRLALWAGLGTKGREWLPKRLFTREDQTLTQQANTVISRLNEELPRVALPEVHG